jgi:hypothetical protein
MRTVDYPGANSTGQAQKNPTGGKCRQENGSVSVPRQDQRSFRFTGFSITPDSAANPAPSIPFFLICEITSPGRYPFSM